MPIEPMQVVLALAVAFALWFGWTIGGRGRWRTHVADRFWYGVPWGTLVTVAIVVAFYALVQGGARHWSEPITLPFITWSYFYPTGQLTAGLAHGSPQHLLSNLAGTVVLAPIAEYAWGHYPPGSRHRADSADEPTSSTTTTNASADGGHDVGGLLARPWFRALVAFPAGLLAAAFLTAVFALGPGLGFSGAVFAIAGFAVVNYPLSTVVAVVATSALQTLSEALAQPIVREALETGPPEPPAWAGIGFQAHLLGFLLGAAAGLFLLRARNRRPAADRIFAGVVLFGMAQSLWLLVWTAEDVFFLYQGIGVVLVLGLAAVVTVAVAGSDRPLPRPLAALPVSRSRVPSRRQLALGWLDVLGLLFVAGLVGAVAGDEPLVWTLGSLAFVLGLLALPALPAVLPDRWVESPVSRRGAAVGVLVVVTVLVAAPSVFLNLTVVGEDAVPGSGEVEVGGYAVTYEENVTSSRTFVVEPDGNETADDPTEATQSGVVVVDPDRELWTVSVRAELLEYEGAESVVLGGFGWRETVHVERTGWDVVGNETAYAVDLDVAGETTRSFESKPVRAIGALAGQEIEVAPTEEAFELRVLDNGENVGSAPIPAVNETASVDDITFRTEDVEVDAGADNETENGTERVIAAAGATELVVAEREMYGE